MNKPIAIFGGSGFIGSFFYKTWQNECIIVPRDEVVPPDGVSKILYLISTVDNYNVLTDPYLDINTNLIHLIKVLEQCKGRDIEFTFISSWFVYGETELPAKEYYCCNPKGFYSITKLAAEQLLESYCKTFNIKYKIIRLGNVIGKNDFKISKKKNALQYLINELKHNRDISLYNGGEFYRDFIDIRDAVDGIKFIMDNGYNHEIYNLGTHQFILFKDIINYAAKKINSTSNISSIIPSEFHKIVQVKSMVLDMSKTGDLGWNHKISVYQSIDDLI